MTTSKNGDTLAGVSEALLQAGEALARRSRMERDVARIEGDLKTERARLADLAETLGEEGDDVRRLEGLSFTGLFYRIMGKKEALLEEERRELLAVEVKYENARHRVEALEKDLDGLLGKLVGMRDLEKHYEQLLNEKEALLRKTGGALANRVTGLDERLARARTEERELREAVLAGEQAATGLQQVVAALESAANWGTWDLLGGGMLSSAVKHSRLDEAQEAVRAVQPLLQRFERELVDVGSGVGLTVEAGDLATFADIVLDCLLIDLLVQSKIYDSLNAARDMANKLHILLAELTLRKKEAGRVLDSLEHERRDLLENRMG